jgi:hypothetical protein
MYILAPQNSQNRRLYGCKKPLREVLHFQTSAQRPLHDLEQVLLKIILQSTGSFMHLPVYFGEEKYLSC